MFNLQATLWRLEASALLEVQERGLPAGAREVRFTQVEGDFKVRPVPLTTIVVIPMHLRIHGCILVYSSGDYAGDGGGCQTTV